jgi:hypothetical protein
MREAYRCIDDGQAQAVFVLGGIGGVWFAFVAQDEIPGFVLT